MKSEAIPPHRSARPDEIKAGVRERTWARLPRRLNLDPPLIPPAGRRMVLTNDDIYELIEFP
jgi:hypothetical protein